MSKQFLANVLTIMVKHRSDRMAALTYETMSPDLATAKSGSIYACEYGGA